MFVRDLPESGQKMKNEFGSGLGEGFMPQSPSQRQQYKARRKKAPLADVDALMKFRSAFYAGESTRISGHVLKDAWKLIGARMILLSTRGQTKVVRMQLKFLQLWRGEIHTEMKKRMIVP